ncbi:hypothetical protein D9M68_836250 [compost metagenome]
MGAPVLVAAPLKIGAIAVFCAALRQLPSRAPGQVGTSAASEKLLRQASTSWIRPSVAPSSASHLPSTAAATVARSALVKPVEMSAGLLATLA